MYMLFGLVEEMGGGKVFVGRVSHSMGWCLVCRFVDMVSWRVFVVAVLSRCLLIAILSSWYTCSITMIRTMTYE